MIHDMASLSWHVRTGWQNTWEQAPGVPATPSPRQRRTLRHRGLKNGHSRPCGRQCEKCRKMRQNPPSDVIRKLVHVEKKVNSSRSLHRRLTDTARACVVTCKTSQAQLWRGITVLWSHTGQDAEQLGLPTRRNAIFSTAAPENLHDQHSRDIDHRITSGNFGISMIR